MPSSPGLFSWPHRRRPVSPSATSRRPGPTSPSAIADGAKGWTAEGWWSIASGDCQTLVKSPLAGSYVYLLVDGGRLPPRARQSGGWFCTDDNGFGTRNADYSNDKHELACEDAGLKTEQFREIKIRGSDGHLQSEALTAI